MLLSVSLKTEWVCALRPSERGRHLCANQPYIKRCGIPNKGAVVLVLVSS